MATSQHLSPKFVVGVGSLLLALVAMWVAALTSGYPDRYPLHSWPAVLTGRLRRELPRRDSLTAAWGVLAGWSVLVSVLHFGGILYDIYTELPWWDLLTHAMGGTGVAAVLGLTFRRSTLRAPLWVVPAVLAIGAGFEVYEFLFKRFWHYWTLAFYIEDTIVDLVVNTCGAAVFALATTVYRRHVDPVLAPPDDSVVVADGDGEPAGDDLQHDDARTADAGDADSE
ncbi:hypothetical protein [Halobellus inordinatus]|uniref:hypothetical protein n=1 Tax=Halobellus inordinatus TaxID=1126236 RepID=UPI00210C32B5|nr:hypothetical protein [Halobellus inordinatus]